LRYCILIENKYGAVYFQQGFYRDIKLAMDRYEKASKSKARIEGDKVHLGFILCYKSAEVD
jgi:hypothetical protein